MKSRVVIIVFLFSHSIPKTQVILVKNPLWLSLFVTVQTKPVILHYMLGGKSKG